MPTSRARKPRIRRTPEDARALILAGAEKVIAERGPDAVGLKDVARAAGVSHGLVTHYFGTYEELVRTVLRQRFARTRDEALAELAERGEGPGRQPLLDELFRLLRDPVHARLAAWAMLARRPGDPMPIEPGGLALVTEAVLAHRAHDHRIAPTARGREDAELAILIAVSAAYGFALGRETFLAALGKGDADEEAEEERFKLGLGALLRAHLLAERPSGRKPRSSAR